MAQTHLASKRLSGIAKGWRSRSEAEQDRLTEGHCGSDNGRSRNLWRKRSRKSPLQRFRMPAEGAVSLLDRAVAAIAGTQSPTRRPIERLCRPHVVLRAWHGPRATMRPLIPHHTSTCTPLSQDRLILHHTLRTPSRGLAADSSRPRCLPAR